MHKQRVAQDFSASALVYDSHAFLQQCVLRELAGEAVKGKILDAGTGTGMLADLWPKAEIIGLDIAEGMCRTAQEKIAQVMVADMESLPLADASVDGIFSSLALQWLDTPEQFYHEAWRVCKKGGWLRVATLVPPTLGSLQAAYRSSGLSVPVLNFIEARTVQQKVSDAGWKVQSVTEKKFTTSHDSVRELLRHFKQLGARHKQQQGMRSPADLQRLENAYPREQDKIAAIWQVLMLEAIKL